MNDSISVACEHRHHGKLSLQKSEKGLSALVQDPGLGSATEWLDVFLDPT